MKLTGNSCDIAKAMQRVVHEWPKSWLCASTDGEARGGILFFEKKNVWHRSTGKRCKYYPWEDILECMPISEQPLVG